MDVLTGSNESERRSDTPDTAEVDALFDVLADARRRRALASLAERDGPTTLAELADAVAARESDPGPGGDGERAPDGGHEPDGSELSRDVRVSLYHVHLPKMADADVVEYTGGGTVRLSEAGERLLDVSALTTA